MKKVIFRTLVPVLVLGAAWYGYRFIKLLPQRQEQVATTKVRKSDVVIRAFSRGELRAVRSITVTAPNLYSTVQVTRLAPMGSLANDKNLLVEFDDSERRAASRKTCWPSNRSMSRSRKPKPTFPSATTRTRSIC